MPGSVIAYFHLTTRPRRRSGEGLEAQSSRVAAYAKARGCAIAGRHIELESRKGADDWPALRRALQQAKRSKSALLIAQLGELWKSRVVIALLHGSGVEFECCDIPHATHETVGLLAALAEQEVRRNSERTKAALAAYKTRGGSLGARNPQCRNLSSRARRKGVIAAAEANRRNADGFYVFLGEWIGGQRSKGRTLQAIADALNARGTPTRRGKLWNATQVKRVLSRAR
jgi:DNA invertase Pin-like site-specific DNA recombinase